MLFEALFFIVPAITALVYNEEEIFDFLAAMLLCVMVGALCLIGRPKNTSIYPG